MLLGIGIVLAIVGLGGALAGQIAPLFIRRLYAVEGKIQAISFPFGTAMAVGGHCPGAVPSLKHRAPREERLHGLKPLHSLTASDQAEAETWPSFPTRFFSQSSFLQ